MTDPRYKPNPKIPKNYAGKPYRNKRLNILLSATEMFEIKAIAKCRGLSVSALIRLVMKNIYYNGRLGIKTMISKIMRFCCEQIARLYPNPRVIHSRDGSSQYLTRIYLLGKPRSENPFDKFGNPTKETQFSKFPINIMLHKFHRSDEDEALHNHPWKWSFSIILAGGYVEERIGEKNSEPEYEEYSYKTSYSTIHKGFPKGEIPKNEPGKEWRKEKRSKPVYDLVIKTFKPFSLNVIRDSDYHKVTLLEKDSWSLFVSGPRSGGWGFLSPSTGEYKEWQDYIASKRPGWEQSEAD